MSIHSISTNQVISVIMGGGAGTRLFPLTKERAKPAVPLAGKYRLVDIPISNCINSDMKRIFLLTQFNSSSMHRHVQQSFRFDTFSAGFVEIVAAQQTPKNATWYQGTADAVRQNLCHFASHQHEYVLILSGDQLYRMDFRKLLEQHIAKGAEVTVATIPVSRDPAKSFGIMQIDHNQKIHRFVEKPKDDALLNSLRLDSESLEQLGHPANEELYLASMGIYLFNKNVLAQALSGNEPDFGKNIIPNLIQERNVSAYVFQGYWEDIGTISAFYDATLDLCEPIPKFNLFDAAPIYSHARYLPATKMGDCQIDRSIIAEGCIIMEAKIHHSLVGIRSRIQSGCVIKDSIIMGQDYYETMESIQKNSTHNIPRMGIGNHCQIEKTIVDKNARIGDHVRISPEGKPANFDGENYYIRDGIVVIPKGAILTSGTVI